LGVVIPSELQLSPKYGFDISIWLDVDHH